MATFWNRSLAKVYPELRGEARAQVTVVGGSFAGLSCAYRLAQRGYDVIVIEKHLFGEAAGRSGGLVAASAERDLSDYVAIHGKTTARAIWRFATDGVQDTENIISDLGISAASGFEKTGSIYLGTPSERRYLSSESHLRRSLGFECSFRDIAANPLRERGYTCAVAASTDCTIDPTAFCRALSGALQERYGVRIFERSAVLQIDCAARQCTTEKGRVRSDVIILAGQHVPEQFGFPARQLPCATYCLVTEPLSPATLMELGLERRISFWNTAMPFYYGRLTPDDRLLFGGGDLLLNLAGGRLSTKKMHKLEQALRTLLPALSETPTAYCWEGANRVTSDGLPRIGMLQPAIYAIACAAGIGQAITSGRLMAEVVSGASRTIPDYLDYRRKTRRFPRMSSPLLTMNLASSMLGLT